MEALESWETPIVGFFIRSHHGVPQADLDRWVIRIDGLVEKPITLTLKELQKFPLHTLHAVLECSGNYRGLQKPQVPGVQWGKGAVGNAAWSGALLSEVLKKARVKPSAKFARIEGADKPALAATPAFVRSVPLSKIMEEGTLLAWKMNRQPMPTLHGGPLRLILPNWYGQNWIKWVTHITLTDAEDKGFYMAKGYRMPKEPVKPGEKWDSATGLPVEKLRVQSLVVSPRGGDKIGAGEVTVKGKAFSGHGTISKVEISSDEGSSWKPAKLEPPHKTGGWQEFEITLSDIGTGNLALLSKATDSAGNTQPMEAEWNPPGYLRNTVDKVEVEVVKQPLVVEESLLAARCLTCHTRELISSQRLSEAAWEKTVTKMEGFGMKLEGDEKGRLLKYLAQWGPSGPKEVTTPTSFWLEDSQLSSKQYPPGNSGRGRGLYAKSCASCHGKTGEGGSAPTLRGKDISLPYFWAVVSGGKGNMPAFSESLSRAQVADIESFLRERPARL